MDLLPIILATFAFSFVVVRAASRGAEMVAFAVTAATLVLLVATGVYHFNDPQVWIVGALGIVFWFWGGFNGFAYNETLRYYRYDMGVRFAQGYTGIAYAVFALGVSLIGPLWFLVVRRERVALRQARQLLMIYGLILTPSGARKAKERFEQDRVGGRNAAPEAHGVDKVA